MVDRMVLLITRTHEKSVSARDKNAIAMVDPTIEPTIPNEMMLTEIFFGAV
jgi:hypothetical protein